MKIICEIYVIRLPPSIGGAFLEEPVSNVFMLKPDSLISFNMGLLCQIPSFSIRFLFCFLLKFLCLYIFVIFSSSVAMQRTVMNRVRMDVLLNGWLWLLYSLTVPGVMFPAARSHFLTWNVAYQRHHSQQLKILVSSLLIWLSSVWNLMFLAFSPVWLVL